MALSFKFRHYLSIVLAIFHLAFHSIFKDNATQDQCYRSLSSYPTTDQVLKNSTEVYSSMKKASTVITTFLFKKYRKITRFTLLLINLK